MAAHSILEQHFEKLTHQKLGLKPDFLDYWMTKCSHYVLDSSRLCEDSSGFTITLSYKIENFGNSNSPNLNSQQASSGCENSPKRKKKSPSTKKRDIERFRTWLANKKLKKTQKVLNTAIIEDTLPSDTQPASSSPTPMPPPPYQGPLQSPTSAPVPVTPEPADMDPVAPESAAPEPTPVKEPCKCADCERFTFDEEPYADFKQHCEWALCDVTAGDMVLRNCTRCYLVVYCSREHQKEDWYLHKEVCCAEDGVKCRQEIEEWQRWKAEAHHHQLS